ncbi:ribonuclease [Trypanosoma rangeli]|uniref:Ribonuclease n=1 Tax=Trypanosoma rangeli TaxID=5698 RepID=A0A3R7K5K5_TRYRA|nr:ribonuclease [Trypanosoma rangeli]RNF02084.1 ribonuclease [Trypanosoma rangeli]|eukprot:RNF02084.1 ribonuclease [Trypanosoma rangeli]
MNVDKETFPLIFEDFKKTLEGCDFYAVDQEMTGVNFEDQHRSQLMSLTELYKENLDVVRRYVAFQFGITFFTLLEEGIYEVKPYNFYLLKGYGDFVVNTEAIRFLVSHEMDFQKWLASGLHYCNKEEEEKEKEEHCAGKGTHGSSDTEKKIAFHIADKIEEWWLNPSKGEEDTLSFNMIMTEKIKTIVMFLLKQRDIYVHLKYDIISKVYQLPAYITVCRIDSQKANFQEKELGSHSFSSFVETLGFRELWKCLTKCKKPIVGHNFFLDIMFMMHMHEAELPMKYEEFKKQVHALFPCIYDTKTLSKAMTFSIPRTSLHLQGLYKECCNLNEKSKTSIRFYSPPGFHLYDERCIGGKGKAHEAGYDAYMTGIVFAIIKNLYKNVDEMEINDWENVVSVYGSSYYMKLDGNDFLELRSTFLLEFEEYVDVGLVRSLVCTEDDMQQIKNNKDPVSFFLHMVCSKSETHSKTFIAQFRNENMDEKTIMTQINLSMERLSQSLCAILNKQDTIFPPVKRIVRLLE